MIVSLGWWVAIVELVPASWRPYVGGSTNDSVLDLIFGYNGLARILGRTASGSGAAGGRAAAASAATPGLDPAVRAGVGRHDHLAAPGGPAPRRGRRRRDRPARRAPTGAGPR